MTFMNDDHDCMLLLLQLAKSIDHFEHSKNTEMWSREYLILWPLLLNAERHDGRHTATVLLELRQHSLLPSL
jgi:hypothetical protein